MDPSSQMRQSIFHQFTMMFFFYHLLHRINLEPHVTVALGKARGNKTKEAQCFPPQHIVIKLISVGQLARGV